MVEVHSTTTTTTAHYSIKAKKLWSFLRITFFMIRKGLISKRKLIMDMNLLMMKRGKVLRKTLGNYLMFQYHSKTPAATASGGFGIGHYEFSCTNTPINPSAVPFFHAAAKRKHYYHIPCINPPPPPPTDELEEEFEQVQQPPTPSMVLMLPTASKINHSSKYSTSTSNRFAPEEKKMNPAVMVSSSSPLSVRVSNYYSSEGEEDESQGEQEEDEQVDAAAEDFIRRFYEQLRMQNGTQLIQYQEIQYQEMLARGTYC